MTRTNQILAGLAIAQAALVAFTWWPQDRSASLPHPLLTLDPALVTAIAIAAKPADDEPIEWVELSREDDAWALSSASGYPADASKVEELIRSLGALEVRLPIARRESSSAAASTVLWWNRWVRSILLSGTSAATSPGFWVATPVGHLLELHSSAWMQPMASMYARAA